MVNPTDTKEHSKRQNYIIKFQFSRRGFWAKLYFVEVNLFKNINYFKRQINYRDDKANNWKKDITRKAHYIDQGFYS